jgi:TatA/E family protein of Tat protein translocase
MPSWPEIILILAVALIVIGPKKLPDLAKSLGRALGEFKKATNDFKESISMDSTLNEVKDEFKDLGKKVKDPLATSPAADEKGPGAKSDTGTESSGADKDTTETEESAGTDSGAAPDGKVSDTKTASDTGPEDSEGESTGTENSTGSAPASSSDGPAPPRAESGNDDATGPTDTTDTSSGAASDETATPSEGPLKDA